MMKLKPPPISIGDAPPDVGAVVDDEPLGEPPTTEIESEEPIMSTADDLYELHGKLDDDPRIKIKIRVSKS